MEPFCEASEFTYYISLNRPKQFKYVLKNNYIFLNQLYVIAKDGGN